MKPPGVLAALGALWIGAHALGVDGSGAAETMRIGVTDTAFRNLNRDDALASFRVFVQISGTRHGHTIEPIVSVFPDAALLRQAATTGMIEIAWMDAWDCAAPIPGERLQPAFFTSWGPDRIDRRYLLLVRSESGVADVRALRGRVLVECPVIASEMARHWMESLLLTNGFGRPETFFGRIESVDKPSAAVLPVFFGKRDACVVDEAAFALLNEMNPQIGRSLRPVAASVPLPSSVLCLATNGWSSAKLERDVRAAMRDLHLEPGGLQLLTLFKGSRLVAFSDGPMRAVRDLRRVIEPGSDAQVAP